MYVTTCGESWSENLGLLSYDLLNVKYNILIIYAKFGKKILGLRNMVRISCLEKYSLDKGNLLSMEYSI